MRIRGETRVLEKRFYPSLEQATGALTQIYKDKWAVLEGETAHEWRFSIVNPSEESAYRDPILAENLKKMFDLEIEAIPDYRLLRIARGGSIFLESFQHAWALWAWSLWLAKVPRNVMPLLIHLDSHHDLDSPPLRCTKRRGVFRAPFAAELLNLYSPCTVPDFVHRGFIGIGGFICPFLHTLRGCRILHLCLRSDQPVQEKWRQLKPVCKRTGLLGEDALAPGLAVSDSEGQEGCSIQYLLTDDLRILDRLTPAGPVLVDIDLDYFANQFDNRGQTGESGPSLARVCETVDQLGAALCRCEWREKVEVVTTAISPGFFPSSYWHEAIPRLRAVLRKALPIW